MKEFRLCYVSGCWAYFTTQPLEVQQGDDWDDAPYEHNAGEPYESDGGEILKVAFEGDFMLPCDNYCNSPYSVDQINHGDVPWLVAGWFTKEKESLFAGATFGEFVEFVQKHDGQVYIQRGRGNGADKD